MDFFFSKDNLNRATPAETKINSLSVLAYPDGRRVRVSLDVTPFQTRPYIEISLLNARGEEVALANILEPLSWKLELTMHIRGAIVNPFTVNALLRYPDGPTAALVSFSFDVNPSPELDAPAEAD